MVLPVHAMRRRRVLDAMGTDAVALLLGARPVPRSGDTHFPFRQDSDFHYLTGFDHPNAAAVLRTDGGPPYTLFVEPRDPDAETWTGHRPGVEGAVRDHGADEAHPIGELLERVPKLLHGARRLYHVLGRDGRLDARVLETLESMRLRSRTGLVPPDAILDPRGIVHELRLFKDPSEIEVMRRAATITADAHHAAATIMRKGVYEYEIAALLDYTFQRRGACGPAYESIVACGANATTLHYTASETCLTEGELLLVDAGCELDGYASDVTRTYPVGGRFRGPARALYDVVLAAQQVALDRVRPGATLQELHDGAVRRLMEGCIELGLLTGRVEDLIENGAHRRFYMHMTSHWLGLDVHDVGSYSVDGKPRRLEPGMIFTVEPGLYVRSGDEEAESRFRGIGVRIEDDVLVTENGCEILTEALPKDPEEVEALVRGA